MGATEDDASRRTARSDGPCFILRRVLRSSRAATDMRGRGDRKEKAPAAAPGPFLVRCALRGEFEKRVCGVPVPRGVPEVLARPLHTSTVVRRGCKVASL